VRLFVTGAGGQLGHDVVAAALAAGDEVVAVDHSALDITDAAAVRSAILDARPDAVINAAAYTAVDACETNVEVARAINADAVGNIATVAKEIDAHLVHVSTDYVFDGTLDRPYHEWDNPVPGSVYGASKLGGEHEALELGADAAVVRTSWVCGEHGSNMVTLVRRLAAQRAGQVGGLAFVDDQRGCPSFTADLGPMLRRVALDRRSGVIHLTNQGAVTWYEFVVQILRALGHDPALVRPISTAELDPPRAAPRPANSVLDNAVLRAAGVPLLRDFRDGPLQELVNSLDQQAHS
jgi:dTDP-4-dehydrorhamnose reductase